jgi:hypothetical protein
MLLSPFPEKHNQAVIRYLVEYMFVVVIYRVLAKKCITRRGVLLIQLLSVTRMMYRALAIGLAIIVCTTSILGATVASLDGHPYWYVSRVSAILSGLALVAINMLNKNKDIKILKYGVIAVLFGIIISLASLAVINIYEASLVSNRSYGHVIGSFIIICFVIGLGMLLSKVKHLTRPFSGNSR